MENRKGKNRCFECWNGEHEDYDDNIKFVVVYDPDSNKMYQKGYICQSHIEKYLQDGYIVKER